MMWCACEIEEGLCHAGSGGGATLSGSDAKLCMLILFEQSIGSPDEDWRRSPCVLRLAKIGFGSQLMPVLSVRNMRSQIVIVTPKWRSGKR